MISILELLYGFPMLFEETYINRSYLENCVTFMTWLMFAMSVLVFPVLFIKTAPYGRHFSMTSSHTAFCIPSRLAWFIQEAPSFFIPTCLLLLKVSQRWFLPHGRILCLFLFILHYFHRALIFPWLMRGDKKTPILIPFLAFLFCLTNGLLQSGDQLLSQRLPLTSCHLIIGTLVFFLGAGINIHSDHKLRQLRSNAAKDSAGYQIPTGGFYRWVSCANYFGEIVEWGGYAIASWSLPALAFFAFTIANLIPRAVAHHRWYKAKFEDYPKHRKAVLPYLL